MAQDNVIKAITAIRQDVMDAKARRLSATPLYIIAPPSPQAMRPLVRPVKYQNKLNIIELRGEELSTNEREEWSRHRTVLLKENTDSFTIHLVKHLHALAPLKQRMRMRVHFGHLNLRQWPKSFTQGSSFSGFAEVLGDPRAQASAIFNKGLLDAETGKVVGRRLADTPELFSSVYGRKFSLEDVEFSHMLCIFFKSSQNIRIRLEADIDRNGFNEYQLGSLRYFRDNNQNKHVEISNIDIERYVIFPN
jgi:hypothetical protein